MRQQKHTLHARYSPSVKQGRARITNRCRRGLLCCAPAPGLLPSGCARGGQLTVLHRVRALLAALLLCRALCRCRRVGRGLAACGGGRSGAATHAVRRQGLVIAVLLLAAVQAVLGKVLHLKLPGAGGGVVRHKARALLRSHLFQLAHKPAGRAVGRSGWSGERIGSGGEEEGVVASCRRAAPAEHGGRARPPPAARTAPVDGLCVLCRPPALPVHLVDAQHGHLGRPVQAPPHLRTCRVGCRVGCGRGAYPRQWRGGAPGVCAPSAAALPAHGAAQRSSAQHTTARTSGLAPSSKYTSIEPLLSCTVASRSRLRTSVGSSQRTDPTPRRPTQKLDTAARLSGSSRAMAASCVGGGRTGRLSTQGHGSGGRLAWQDRASKDSPAAAPPCAPAHPTCCSEGSV